MAELEIGWLRHDRPDSHCVAGCTAFRSPELGATKATTRRVRLCVSIHAARFRNGVARRRAVKPARRGSTERTGGKDYVARLGLADAVGTREIPSIGHAGGTDAGVEDFFGTPIWVSRLRTEPITRRVLPTSVLIVEGDVQCNILTPDRSSRGSL